MAPQFVGGSAYHLAPGSPLIDSGPSPSTFQGSPCNDLDGGPRLRDGDGDHLARMGPGAYETAVAHTPGPVTGLVWTGKTTLGLSSEPSAAEYHVYRANLDAIGYDDFGLCRNGLDASRTDTVLSDAQLPAPGQGYFYGITAEDAGGNQGSLGFGSCVERGTYDPCP